MKKLRKILQLILMIWPYLSVLYIISPKQLATGSGLFIVYSGFTIIVYILNIWNAYTYPDGNLSKGLEFYDMLIKLVHIPFYIGVFIIGFFFVLVMVVPAFILISPMLVLFLAIIDFCLMLTSSMYGINAAVRLMKRGVLSRKTAWLHILLHLIFVTDIASAVCLYRVSKNK